MKEEYEPVILHKNEIAHQFEMMVDGHKSIITYKEDHFTITLLHTEVPPELEGRGVATAIIEKTLNYIEKNHLRLVPLCPFIITYIKRHPQWKMVLDASVVDKF
jgi:predicted GNAT family acetyltransferase